MEAGNQGSRNNSHISILDALRGFLAFWVYYGHVKMASVGKDVIWGSPALAVDGFMLLSGFLMAYHWILREERFESFKHQVKDFYIRRFFRIAPLYYLLLTAAFYFQDKLSYIKNTVNTLVPPPWKGRFVIFDSPVFRDLSFANLFTHYTFTFGLFPKFSNSNILPDWSIGLEMQFYLIFPLLIILISRIGPFSLTFTSLMLAIATNKLFGLYQEPGLLGKFPQPSFLLFKINYFLAGMAIAYAYLSKDNKKKLLWILLGAVSIYGSEVQVVIIAAVLVFLLIFDPEKNELLSKIGSWKVFKFFGDTSYSVYLVHLLIMYPILYFLFEYPWFLAMSDSIRFAVSLLIISPIVYGCAYVLYQVVESNGIRLGKEIIKKLL